MPVGNFTNVSAATAQSTAAYAVHSERPVPQLRRQPTHQPLLQAAPPSTQNLAQCGWLSIAVTFDDFLDHGAEYLKRGQKNEAAVIAGIVFEDTIRRICRTLEMDEKGVPLETLFTELTKRNVLSGLKVKHARAAAGFQDQGYFADGITEDLTTDLSRIADMLVISRNSAFTYKDKPVNAKQIGRELNVRYVLEGSIRRSGDRVRANAQLIDAETDAH
jgi:TolB-like protein